jgi:DNA segregation ATPase FtsK/SpoIIIE, S-DNA-T family
MVKNRKKTTKKTEQKKKGTKTKNSWKAFWAFFKDERFTVTVGVVFIAFSILLALSFTSYLFTWKSDQSILNIPFHTLLFDNSIEVDNWVGKIGAVLSNLMIHNWFGLASFSIIFIFILIGFRLLKVKILPLSKTVFLTIIITIWLSIVLAYFFADRMFYLGGAHGYFLCSWLNGLWGKIGTLILIVFSTFVISIFSFKNSLSKIKAWIIKLRKIKKEDFSEDADENILNNNSDEIADIDSDTHIAETNTDDSKDADNSEEKASVVEFDDTKEEIIKDAQDTPDKNEQIDLSYEKAEADDEIPESDISSDSMDDYDPTLDLEFYKRPTIDLLKDYPKQDNEIEAQELNENKDRIVKTLQDYKIEISKIKATIGPTVTLYEIVPAAGVRISKIKNLEDDIALSLSALGIRIIAPIPGRGTIGIEVPNSKPEIVSMRSVIRSAKFQESHYELPIALGKTINNETFVFNLAKAPHLLVAGATGQGKSVGINAIITSLLYKKHPSQLKFVMVDPKMVELSMYSRIERHFLAKLPDEESAIITDVKKVVPAMNSLCTEMDERYKLLNQATVRNIIEYNDKFTKRKLNPQKGHRYLPYIVVIIDEFADIIIQEGKEVETPISRLAAKARAIGIHLIVATQRPSTDVITGVIKANFPSRVAFKVSSGHDSKTILDSTGAQQLIGRGDMLMVETGKTTRIQCAFVDTPEVDDITEFIGKQQGYTEAMPLPEPEVAEGSGGNGSFDDEDRDALFEEAARLIVRHQQGSTSLIQRKMKIGYNRAGRIIDQLEQANIVGPYEGSKARQVMFQDEYSLEQYLSSLDNK